MDLNARNENRVAIAAGAIAAATLTILVSYFAFVFSLIGSI